MWKLIALIFFMTSELLAGGVVVGGNGGDPIPVQLLHAKIWSYKIATQFDAQYFPKHFPDPEGKVRAWIEKNHIVLAENLMASEHQGEMVGRVDGRCAWTNIEPNLDTIHYYIPDCENKIKTLDDAVQLLIHETVHHFEQENIPGSRISDETFCDSVALALYLTYQNQLNSERPRWDDTTAESSPAKRAHHSAVWTGYTGDENTNFNMIVWGGCSEARFGALCSENSYLNDVVMYKSEELESGSWEKRQDEGAPSPRAFHSSVWTGHTQNPQSELKMLIWGGCAGKNCWEMQDDGSIYDPKTKAWKQISRINAPRGRIHHSTLWLDKEMFIWGGEKFGTQPEELSDGALYNPTTDTWKLVSNKDAPSARKFHSAIWTGDKGPFANKVIVWGGCSDTQFAASCKTPFNDGAIYDIKTDSWTSLPANNLLSERYKHTSVWTGEEMVVWGGAGKSPSQYFADGAIYNPLTNQWRPVRGNGPSARSGHSTVWTDGKMLVFAGMRKVNGLTVLPEDMGELTLQKNGNASWGILVSPNLRRIFHSSVWTGQSLFTWGGKGEGTEFLNSGVAFFPKLEND